MAESHKSFRLEVVTPERTVYDDSVTSIVAPAEGGRLGVLANHAPLIALLQVGMLVLREPDGELKFMMIGDGILEVKDNHARILAGVGEMETEIDLERAVAAEKRARARMKEPTQDFDLARAEAALARAIVRQQIVGRVGTRRGGR